eukprot:m.192760 g.192760  ORF g.192760 m.192760 type:complete len:145 (+) comp14864_c1_seq1:2710-3144(+)
MRPCGSLFLVAFLPMHASICTNAVTMERSELTMHLVNPNKGDQRIDTHKHTTKYPIWLHTTIQREHVNLQAPTCLQFRQVQGQWTGHVCVCVCVRLSINRIKGQPAQQQLRTCLSTIKSIYQTHCTGESPTKNLSHMPQLPNNC